MHEGVITGLSIGKKIFGKGDEFGSIKQNTPPLIVSLLPHSPIICMFLLLFRVW